MRENKIFKVVVSGIKPYKIENDEFGFHVVTGEEIVEIYTVKAPNQKQAEEIAIKNFERNGGYFDEIIEISVIGTSKD